MNFTVEVQPGKEVRLPTGGKYCPKDILLTGGELPPGTLKVDPAWTEFSYLCSGRPTLGLGLQYGDTANGKSFLSMCQAWTSGLGMFSVPSWDLRNATTIQNMFIYSDGIEEIGEMNIPNVTKASNAFSGCTALKRISFAPGCIRVSIGFPQSNLLDGASVQSILDGLADLRGKESQTVTFHPKVGENLTPAQKAAVTAKNWTLVF